MAGVLNDLEQTALPSVFSSLNTAGLVDTMTIKADAPTISDGRRVKGTVTNAYTSVPVAIETADKDARMWFGGDKSISTVQYLLTFPKTQSGSRINVDPKIHRFVTDTRGNEPAKTFRIIGIRDGGGVYEAVCEREG